jgi:hypothetical protein
MRAISIGICLGLVGCGPSPAMQQRAPKPPPNAVVVVVDCDAAEEAEDDDAVAIAATKANGVEYVRIDEWQSPPAAREIEARIEPRGNKPPDYVSLPSLTKHREIAPMTTYRTGRYWW